MSYLTDQEKAVIKYTLLGGDLLHCPLLGCARTIYLKAVPVSESVAGAFGMSGETLARIHAEQETKSAARDMLRHLEGHSPIEWLKFCESTTALVHIDTARRA